MKTTTRILTLRLLGHAGCPSARHGGRLSADGAETPEVTRRAALVIRPGESATVVRKQLNDTIRRLAGGPVICRGTLVDRILSDLRREPSGDSRSRAWTLARVRDGRTGDPYAPLSPMLTLIDPPIRGRTWTRRAVRTKRTIARPQPAYS